MHTTTIKKEIEIDVQHKWAVGDVLEWDYNDTRYEVKSVIIDPVTLEVLYNYSYVTPFGQTGWKYLKKLTDPTLRLAQPPRTDYTYWAHTSLPDTPDARLNLLDDLNDVLAKHNVGGSFTYNNTSHTAVTFK